MLVDLSVCIVAYHNYDDIKHAISSLEKFTPATITRKIYIVDNSGLNEEDDSRQSFEKFLKVFPDVEYLDEGENLGFGRANNVPLQVMDSKYHCIMNPDILFKEDAFTPIIKYLEENDNVGMVIPNIIGTDGERQKVYRKELTVFDMFIRMFCKNMFPKRMAEHTLQYEDYSKPFHVPFGQGSFLVIRSELFKSLEGFDDHFFMYVEDADLSKSGFFFDVFSRCNSYS